MPAGAQSLGVVDHWGDMTLGPGCCGWPEPAVLGSSWLVPAGSRWRVSLMRGTPLLGASEGSPPPRPVPHLIQLEDPGGRAAGAWLICFLSVDEDLLQ